MKRILLIIRGILSLTISTTAGLALIVAICCLDGAPYPCAAVISASLAWLYFRARANCKKYGRIEGDAK